MPLADRPPAARAPFAGPPAPNPAPVRAAPATSRCANCGATADRAFCPECGQEQHDLHRSLRGVAGELLDAVAGWDGKIPATFRLLLLRPGALTAEFLAGRRTRYLRPLRVFLIASVALVLALQTPGGDTGLRVRSTGSVSVVARADSARGARVRARRDRVGAPIDSGSALERRLERAFKARWAELGRLPAGEMTAMLKRAFLARLGTTLFLLVPVFALLVRVLWRRAPYFYAEHAVFALHAHAHGMLVIALVHLLPGGVGALVLAWGPAYLWFALRRVYGRGHESRRRTTAKFVALAGSYGVVLFVGLTITFLVALLAGE